MRTKQFNESVKVLRKFCKENNIKIRIVNNSSYAKRRNIVAYFRPSKRMIMLFKNQCKSIDHMLYALAHEVGHSIDFDSYNKKDKRNYQKLVDLSTYFLSSGLKIPKLIKKFIFDIEKIACTNGEKIIEKYNIGVSKEYQKKFRDELLLSYRIILKNSGKGK